MIRKKFLNSRFRPKVKWRRLQKIRLTDLLYLPDAGSMQLGFIWKSRPFGFAMPKTLNNHSHWHCRWRNENAPLHSSAQKPTQIRNTLFSISVFLCSILFCLFPFWRCHHHHHRFNFIKFRSHLLRLSLFGQNSNCSTRFYGIREIRISIAHLKLNGV